MKGFGPLPLAQEGGLIPARVSRRAVLLAAAALTLPRTSWIGAIAGRVSRGLLRSYDVDPGGGDFDRSHATCAYAYDNAAAGLALLAAEQTAPALVLGNALLAAQSSDRFWKDGRLRNAYAAGPQPELGPVSLPGWWDARAGRWIEDAYQAGTATGVVAWAMLFWAALTARTGDARFRAAANRAGDWVVHTVRVEAGYSGGFLGWEPKPQKLGWISTEHNLDLAVAFAALGRIGDADHAKRFVDSMWNGREGRFFTGLRPDGSVNTHPAADANLWPGLTSFAQPDWIRAVDWTVAHQGVPQNAPQGIDFDDDRDGIWLEGTAYLALAACRSGGDALRARCIATLEKNTTPDGFVWACTTPHLTTGLATGVAPESAGADFVYFRRPHLGATGWAALARLGKSPFLM